MPFDERPAQTRVKHAIVREYVGAWAGIIKTGLAGRSLATEFAYVDGFAGCGQYACDVASPAAGPVPGSPIIGMTALGRALAGSTARATGIFIESDRACYEELCEHSGRELAAWPLDRIDSPSAVALGRITAARGDFRTLCVPLVDSLPANAFAFVLVDPYGTSAHMGALTSLVRRQKTDLIVYFPSHEVQWRGAVVNKAAPEAQDIENMRRVSEVFGSDDWKDIARRTELSPEDRIEAYVELYGSRLRAAGRPVSVKSIGLRFADSPITTPGYHLFLITGNADGAMRMNDILRKAEVWKHVARLQDIEASIQSRGNIELFDSAPAEPEAPAPDPNDVLNDVVAVLPSPGVGIEWRHLKGLLADSIYTESEIKQALGVLRKRETIDAPAPSALKNSTIITAR